MIRAAFITCCLLLYVCSYAQTLTANFKSDITGGCSPIIVNFQDQSTGNPVSWLWDFGNGGTSTKQNPAATYFDVGNYTIKLTVTNANGTTHTVTKTAYITVFNEPKAEFATSTRNGCTPAKIQFSDRSTSPTGTTIVGWKWDFGDGGSSTEQNPTYTYRTPGSFTVTLTVTNDKGCTRLITKPNYIDIIQGVVPAFDNSNPVECSAPATVNFTNRSTGPGSLSYYWNFGDGKSSTSSSTSLSNVYQANGKYTVTLGVTSSLGCTDTARREIEIGKVKTEFTVPASICPKSPVQFVNTSSPRPNQTFWRFSDGQTHTLRNPIVAFAAGGTYTVTLINTYDICTDSLTKTFTVLPAPKLDFTVSDTGKCQAPLTVNFTSNTTGGVNYIWQFGDGGTATGATSSHTYTAFGEYDVTLIAGGANGCTDTLKKPKLIKIKKPEIKFLDLPRGGCLPYTSEFEAQIKTVDPVVAWSWNFGDGGSSTQEKPTYTYTKKGTYAVSLTITTKGGCTETFTLQQAIKVGNKPDPQFTANKFEGCAYRDIQFINQTVDTLKLEYFWEFSDGSTSKEVSPLHTFTGVGPIDVTLTAIDNGCENKITKKQFVTVKPSVAKFDYTPNCNNRNEYTFTDKSIGAQSWSWNINGTTVTGQNPGAYTFPGAGTYKVSLTTNNATTGCSYTLEREIKVIDQTPSFTIASVAGCKPFYTTFQATSPNPKAIKEYVWDFGNGTTNTSVNGDIGNTFYTAGTFNVTVATIDSFNCKDVSQPLQVRVSGPEAGFSSLTNSGCKGLTTTFTDTSRTDGVSPIVSWRWDFGDSTIQTYTAPPFQHTYDTTGDFNVKLTVTDALGCTDSTINYEFVKISTLKAAWDIHTQSCPNAPMWFGNATKSDIKFTSVWDFGNGETQAIKQVWYAYKDTGHYTVKLTVTDELGCQDSIVKQNAVRIGIPKAAFDANNFTTYCTPFEAKFTNESDFYNSSFWTLGRGRGTSTQQNPNSYYTETGNYDIKLVVTSPGGCKDSVTKTLTVYNPGDATIKYDPLFGCRPLPVEFEAFSKMKAKFIWDFGDGNVTDTSENVISHAYDNLGTFIPRIILIQPEGCMVPLRGKEPIEVIGAKAMIDVNKKLFCDSGYLYIKDSTINRDPISRYTWNFGDGTISNDQNLTQHYYTTPGNYEVSLLVETETGCRDSAIIKPVKVVASPLIRMDSDSVICVNDFIRHAGIFERQDTSFVHWRWQFPNGNNALVQYPAQQQYTKAGNFTVTAIATNTSGCADTATRSFLVNPLPTVDMPSSITMLSGFPVTIPATYSNNVVDYTWSPATGLSCTNCPQPVAAPKFNTKYSVTFTDSNGCVNTGLLQVVVLCKDANYFVPNTFSPNGDGSNDVFYVRGKGLERVKSLRVFNRWGEVVFEKKDFPVNDPSAGWDGRYKGAKAHPDVYVYQVEVFCDNGDVIKFDGNVALIQ